MKDALRVLRGPFRDSFDDAVQVGDGLRCVDDEVRVRHRLQVAVLLAHLRRDGIKIDELAAVDRGVGLRDRANVFVR